MGSELPQRNQVGMPPPGRSIHRRRAEQGAEAGENGNEPADARTQLLMSVGAFTVVLLLGLLLAWLVL